MEMLHGPQSEISAAEWDGLLSEEDSVFLEHGFLSGLEDSGCVHLLHGWQPRFVTVRQADGRLVGAVPLYLKFQGHGEFCEESGWIRAAMQMRMHAWPRLFVGVPFTPHRGRRLLTASFLAPEGQRRVEQALLSALKVISVSTGLSLNVAFGDAAVVDRLSGAGFITRPSRQTVWRNREPEPYRDFGDFLGALRVKNGTEIARQRQAVAAVQGLETVVVDGTSNPEAVTPELMSSVFKVCYASTQERHGNVDVCFGDSKDGSGHRRYDLSEDFFRHLAAKFAHRVLLVLARAPAGGPVVAGALCFAKGRQICGRYWGHRMGDDRPVPFLHFECCYHALIDHAIRHGYSCVEPGNGGGSIYKVQRFRGFEPAVTPSSLLVPNPRLRALVAADPEVQEAYRDPSWTKGRYSAYAPTTSRRGRRKGAPQDAGAVAESGQAAAP
jgi:hypothetical protein